MVLASPLRTVDTTSTDGVGTYTLDDPASPGGGLRTLADAVAMGHVSDGDTIEYNVEDDTTEGAALLFEEGVGTVGNSGLTVTRDTILSNHNGDTNPVNWQTGGSRSFTVSLASKNVCRTANNLSDVDDADTAADNIGAARLNAANDFTEQQDVAKSVAGVLTGFRVRNTQAAATANWTEYQWRVLTSAAERSSFQVRSRFSNTTDGSQTTETLFQQWNGGSFVDVLKLSGNSALDVNGNIYEAFPSGMDLISSTVPTGYTRSNANQSRLIRLAKSGETLGSEAGGDDIFDGSWATAGHSLQISELASHGHAVFHGTTTVQSGVDVVTGRVLSSTGGDDQTTGSTGSGTAHTHSMTTPYYRIMARIVKS